MAGRIIIIHQSEVVRLGFKFIIRRFCEKEILLYGNYNEFEQSGLATRVKDLFMIQPRYANQFSPKQCITLEQDTPVTNNRNELTIFSSPDEIKASIQFIERNISEQKTDPTDANALTDRETDVLTLIAYGNSNKEIADKLFISVHTVISHRKNITEKLGIKSISGLTVYAMLNRLIDPESIDISDLI